jgi:hypothetical protein
VVDDERPIESGFSGYPNDAPVSHVHSRPSILSSAVHTSSKTSSPPAPVCGEHVERNIVPVVHLDQLFKLGEFMARHIALFRSMCLLRLSTSEDAALGVTGFTEV